MKRSFLFFSILFLPCYVFAQDLFTVSGSQYYLQGTDAVLANASVCSNGYFVVPQFVYRAGHKYTVTQIGPRAFRGSQVLRRIDLPYTVRIVPDSAFADCSLLESVYIGCGVDSLGTDLFVGCPLLTDLQVDGMNKKYSTQGLKEAILARERVKQEAIEAAERAKQEAAAKAEANRLAAEQAAAEQAARQAAATSKKHRRKK